MIGQRECYGGGSRVLDGSISGARDPWSEKGKRVDRTTISNGRISATIKQAGAELCSLRDEREHELIWQAGPEWPRHAPILFPIVGRLKNDALRARQDLSNDAARFRPRSGVFLDAESAA